MKRSVLFIIITALSAALFIGCGAPAENKPANTANANAEKKAPAAPTADALLALDKQANEAYLKGDSKFFEDFLNDKFVMTPGGHRAGKADSIKMIAGVKCDVKEWKLEEPQMAKINDDTYVLSYKGTFDGTCNDGPDGKVEKIPSPVRAGTVWVRNGEKWQAVYHGETMIVEPKAPAGADKTDAKPAAGEKKEEPKKAEPAKEEPKKAEPARAETKKEEPKKDEKTVTNTASAPAADKPVADANTEALVKIHTSGWEAWKAKDAKKLEEITASNLSVVDPMGGWHSGRADIIKMWTEEACKDVNSVKVTDGFASAVSPTVEILTLKGTADGTCNGQKNGSLWQTAVYVKEGEAWKLAFMFESPAKG
jgi:ketosteroid isomerase-like protein